MSSSYNYEKALSIDWNGQVFVLTVRNETPLAPINYLYSSDGQSWYSSSDLSNSQLLTQSNPYNVKWTGSNFAMIGNVANVSGNTILRSGAAATKFSALSTTGQGTNAPLYDLEANLEFPHTITFPRNTTLALGGAPADTTKIAYSLDAGITWTPSANSSTVFSTCANNAVWNGKLWVAVGQGGNTIATSVDGNVWTGRGSYIFTVAGQGIAWSPQLALWVAAGQGTNSLAYSADGVYWTGLGTTMLSSGADVQWNGTIWSAVGGLNATNKSIAYSYDGKNWSNPTQTNLFDISGIKTAWNGYFWTAIGSSTPANNIYNIGTSVDGIYWFMQKNTNFSANITNMFTNPTATNEILFTTYGQVPGAPTALTYTSNNVSSVSFSFTAPVGGVTPSSYTVSAVPVSGQTISQTFAYGGTTGTITGLTSATSYTISLYSNGSTGSSVASNSITAQTTLTPPTNLTFVSNTATYINISFTPPTVSSGVTITSYNATAVPVSGSTVISTGISGAGTSASITGLVASTQYSITLTATNSYGTSTSSTALVYQTALSPPYSLLASMVDTSSVSLSFIAPTLGTNVSVNSYTVTLVPTTGPTITVNNITSSPVSVNGLTYGMNYNITMVAINSYGTSAPSTTYNYTLSTLLIISGVVAGSTGTGLIAGNVTNDVISGTSTTNSVTYNVYSFQPGTSILPSLATSSQATYTINYNTGGSTLIYVLAVGGGGGAGTYCGGGGGAGGVVMNPVTLPSGAGTISVNVGAGGLGQGTSGANYATPVPVNGSNTTVSFSANTNANIIAYGGGFGQGFNNTTGAGNGGSGGGAGNNGGLLFGKAINQYNNYGNPGSLLGGANSQGCGGGGAGNVGTQNLVAGLGAASNGGPGIQCFLPGISNFAPSGTPYGTYYWGGGGGGGGNGQQAGNGGIGGGGGGTSSGAITTYGGTGGGLALNAGGNGSYGDVVTVGAGGANTGGGGGASVHNIAGIGGSGIVVIALPSNMLVTNNGAAVLPSSIYGSGFYNAVLNNASLSAGAYSSIKGAFACRLLNYNYFGPTVTLRYNTDTTGSFTQNFYTDICGNMGTGYLGTGQSVSSWLSSNSANTTYAFVTKWYNQGMDVSFNSATQYTLTNQPTYDVSYGVVNYGYTGGIGISSPNTQCYLSLPNSAFPYGNSAFTYSIRWYNFNGSTATGQSFFEAGTGSGMVAMYFFNSPNYQLGFASGTSLNSSAVSYLPSSSWTVTYDGTTNAYSYVAGTNTFTATQGARSQVNTNNQIGGGAQSYYGQIQMYNFYVFSTVISSGDRNIIEATPSLYAPLPQMTITLSSITVTNFVATWANVTNATIYIAYINGTANGIVTSGLPITPGFGGPWATTIYAYDTNNKLLARGYINAFVLSVNSVVAGSTGTGLIAGNPTTDVISGTSTTNGITYNVYSFQPGTSILPPAASSSQATYTINYTCTLATTIYVLAVGGGGGGNSGGGGGGGAGGVVMTPISIPIGTSTITLAVGSGGASGTNGYNTTVNFTANSTFNIIAYGGGNASKTGNGFTVNTVLGTAPSNNYINYANYGGGNTAATTGGGGGGGAGTAGNQGTAAAQYAGGNGGSGIQCFLPGITNFAPSGIPYGTYYWGGGGGGSSSTNANAANNGNGGIGGGGGGANASSLYVGGNGSVGLNNGGAGATNNGAGGSGGINTGGGGGGAWNGASGTGGSGIVIIAFPSNAAIANNQSAVLPSTILSSGLYSAALNNVSFSVGAYNSLKGAFGCRLLNYNYFGPIMTLRHSADTTGYYTQNFYSDISGNMGTGYLGTGQSLSNWLSSNGANTTYAYVTKWYGQGMDVSFNSATQYTVGSQPIYEVANGLINFGYQGIAPGNSYFFNLPNYALPYGDTSYTVTARHGVLNAGNNTALISSTPGPSGNPTYSQNINFIGTWGDNTYRTLWWGNDFTPSATGSTNNVVTSKYTAGSLGLRYIYVNTNTVYSGNGSGLARQQQPTNNYIGTGTNTAFGPCNAQIYNMYISNIALSDADRAIVESTPYQYSLLPTIAGLSSTTISANSFTLSWTAVASVSYYMLWINGSIFATYGAAVITTGTVTHSITGPWQINLYAYNAANVLLASGYTTTTIVMASASVSINSNSGATTATNGANTVFTYTSSGTFTPLTTGYASVLIVGGGGAGGANHAGGGGAGGLVYFDASSRPMFLTAGTTYTVTVGAGGAYNASANTAGSTANGGNSSINGYIASGGGGGGYTYLAGNTGGNGGGGGAGAAAGSTNASSIQAVYSAYYVGGNMGGQGATATSPLWAEGGGGGAGAAGGNGVTSTGGGAGGTGYATNITGTTIYYGGGGGGGTFTGSGNAYFAPGGTGGGGNGGYYNTTPVWIPGGNGTNGLGGGGGGNNTAGGGNGGSGVVIISCPGIPAIAGLSTSSVTATTFVLSWTTVTNAASYILNINGTNYGTSYGVVTTTGTVTPATAYPWNINIYAYNSGSVLLAVGTIYRIVPILPFTTYNNSFTDLSVCSIPSTFGVGTAGSVAVNYAETKMLVAIANNGVYYSTYLNDAWKPFTTLFTSASTASSVLLSSNGTRGAAFVTNIAYYINWSGTTPTYSSFDTATRTYTWSSGMTPDGSTIVINGSPIGISTWNGSTYSAFAGIGINSIHVACNISPDLKWITNGGVWAQTALKYGSGALTSSSSWTSQNIGMTCDDRQIGFLGGGISGPASYIYSTVATQQGGGLVKGAFITPWNNTTGTCGTSVSLNTTYSVETSYSLCPGGSKGNVIYYIRDTGTIGTCCIAAFTFNVT